MVSYLKSFDDWKNERRNLPEFQSFIELTEEYDAKFIFWTENSYDSNLGYICQDWIRRNHISVKILDVNDNDQAEIFSFNCYFLFRHKEEAMLFKLTWM